MKRTAIKSWPLVRAVCVLGVWFCLSAGTACSDGEGTKPPDQQSTSRDRDDTNARPVKRGSGNKAEAAETQEPPCPKTGQAIAATVNGVPIYSKDVESALPRHAFAEMLEYVRNARIKHLIYSEMLTQHVTRCEIQVKDTAIDARVEELKKNPPSDARGCCTYESLEQYMKFNCLTMPDLRKRLRGEIGTRTHCQKMWEVARSKDGAQAIFLDKKRREIEAAYFKVSHILFVLPPDLKPGEAADKALATKMAQAEKAFQRLANGETFEDVAKDVSEDDYTRSRGGLMGFIRKDDELSEHFHEAWLQLKPGQYSRPVSSSEGIHIIRREKTGDPELLDMVESEFKRKTRLQMLEEMKQQTKVVRYGRYRSDQATSSAL